MSEEEKTEEKAEEKTESDILFDEYEAIKLRAHPASERGGWGVRMYGGSFPNPSGSSLNSFSMGDVVCWDDKVDAECSAKLMMIVYAICGYERAEVERVERGQHQLSIAEELKVIDVAAAELRGFKKAIAMVREVLIASRAVNESIIEELGELKP